MNLTSTTEMKLLIAAVILGLVHLVWATVAGAGGHRDTAWLLGPRDDPRPVTGQAARLSRAYANFLETFPLFAVAVIVAHLSVSRADQAWINGLAVAFVGFRILYTLAYFYDKPTLRSLLWSGGLLCVIGLFVSAA